MRYGDIISRALAIAWRHKYLWLLALFAGEGTAGASFSTSFTHPYTSGTGAVAPTPAQLWNEVTAWVAAHVLLLAVSAAAILALTIVLFLLSAVAEGALVRGSSEHDAGRPFSLGPAWSSGAATFWPVLKVKLLAALVTIITIVLIGGLAAMATYSAYNGATGEAVILAIIAVLLGLAAIPFAIVFSVLIMLMVREVVLGGMSTSAALTNAIRLLQRRLGRVALLWLLSVALSLGAGVALTVVSFIALLPCVAIAVSVYLAGGLSAAIVAGAILGVLWLGLLLAASGAVSAFTSTYWTLGYIRLDFEPLPQAAISPWPQPDGGGAPAAAGS